MRKSSGADTSGGNDDPVSREVADERRRLAREIHDVLAHQVTATVLQARAAAAAVRSDPDRAEAYLATIEETARMTLDELRELMGALREGDGLVSAPTPPTPAASPAGTSDLLAVQAVVHRIVLEALTNVSRHAGLADVTVTVRASDDAVEVVVSNEPPRETPPAVQAGTGMGAQGMRERAESLGGTFEAGATSDGGWTVKAVIPTSQGRGDE